jgi:putative GTP pyrophosphokinase
MSNVSLLQATMNSETLRIQYQDNVGRAERLREAVVQQLSELLAAKGLTLGVPMESRVKTWTSLEEKLERKSVDIESVFALDDLIGVRTIFLFRSDLDRAMDLVAQNFDVISREDTGARLSESEFGYQSHHFVVRLPKGWLSLPSLANLGDFVVELQVRTLAQHIWAAASHKLQYKQEAGVPPPLRRSINRVSALLETVDLEFERVLDERRSYVAATVSAPPEDGTLNVDSLAALLSELLPPENKKAAEPYADLLTDLAVLKIDTPRELRKIVIAHLAAAKERDRVLVMEHRSGEQQSDEPDVSERVAKGVFYAHVGLVREALRQELGDAADAVFKERNKRKRPRVRGG